MRVGFTGTREGLTPIQAREFVAWMADQELGVLHHGDCVGADTAAHNIAQILRWQIVVHPGLGPLHLRGFTSGYTVLHPAKKNLERNADIVNATEILVACPRSADEEVRSGTWATVRLARKRHRQIYIFTPDGFVRHEPADGAHTIYDRREGG